MTDPSALDPAIGNRALHPWVAGNQGTIQFGIAYGPRTDWPETREFVQLMESLGFDSYWVMDHPASGFDAWSSLAAIAAVTERMRLGPLVSCIYYRSPAMLARLATDIDRISNGRLVLGIGGGNHEQEFARLGIPFPPTVERLHAVAKTVRTIRSLWGEDARPNRESRATTIRPAPVQQPHIPILIAGGGERITLRQVAELADASNFSPHAKAGGAFGVDDVRRKLAVLHDHCRQIGRPNDDVLRTQVAVPVVLAESRTALDAKMMAIPESVRRGYASSTVACLPDEAITYYRELAQAGLTYFIAGVYGNDVETVKLLAECVMPALSDEVVRAGRA